MTKKERTSHDIELELELLMARLRPLERAAGALRTELRRARSREAVLASGVTPDKVVIGSKALGAPLFFVRLEDFAAWIRASRLDGVPWAEWNGCVYPMADFLSGKVVLDGRDAVLMDDVVEVFNERAGALNQGRKG